MIDITQLLWLTSLALLSSPDMVLAQLSLGLIMFAAEQSDLENIITHYSAVHSACMKYHSLHDISL